MTELVNEPSRIGAQSFLGPSKSWRNNNANARDSLVTLSPLEFWDQPQLGPVGMNGAERVGVGGGPQGNARDGARVILLQRGAVRLP